jgi:hypothetical protein
MDRPPRSRAQRLLTGRLFALGLWRGALVLALCALVLFFLRRGHPPEEVRAAVFATLVTGIAAVAFSSRPRGVRPGRALWILLGGTFLLLGLVLFVPALHGLFRFAPVGVRELAPALAGALACGLALEVEKRLRLARRGRARGLPIQG